MLLLVKSITHKASPLFAGCNYQHQTSGNHCKMCEPLYNNQLIYIVMQIAVQLYAWCIQYLVS